VSRDQARGAAELEAAQRVQALLLRSSQECVPGLTIETVYRPAQEVGGDFFHTAREGELMRVVIGDVSGKGLGAAMLVSAVVGALDTLHDSRPSAVLRALNGLLLARQQGGFATCGCACIAQDGAITLANAGHLAPYSNGEELPLESGLPLGIAAVAEYSETAFQLKSGDRLTLLSDGVVEAQSTSGELFGFDRTAAISVQSAEAIAAAAQAFGQEDDITVLTLTFEVLHA
jgi:serine phosphatase RsbU (regulator of sigma subunit)